MPAPSFFNIIQIISLLIVVGTYRLEREFEQEKNFNEIQGPFSQEEYQEMRTEAQRVVDFLMDNKVIEAISSKNSTSTLSSMEFHMKSERNHTDSLICKTCLWTFSKFHNLLERKYGLTLLNEFLTILCSIGLDHKICHAAIDLYSPIIIDSIIEHYLDAEYICSKSHICKFSHYIELDPDDYTRELLKDKPQVKPLQADPSASILKVLHLTDFHTDLSYSEGSIGLCPDPLCCHKENGQAKSKGQSAGRWGFQGKCDIPLRTLDLFVETVVNEIKPDLIVWTGDNPPHNPWLDNAGEIYNITKVFIDLLYNKYHYDGSVFAALGNHEEYVADQYNPYETQREKDFLKNMGDMFRNWLSDSDYEQFIKHGYYSTKFKNTDLRIIAINCFLCDIMNFFLIRNPTDPGHQFKWLEATLRQAEKDGEAVIIIGHIPPGDSTYLSQCSKRYNALVDRFSHIIRGQFYGHTHYDEFRVVNEYFNQTNIAGLILTSPSLTTYSWKNPSFRVYELDSVNKVFTDYKQYRLNLTEANLTPDIKPQFKVAYSAREAFGFKHLNDFAPFRKSIDKMLVDKDWFKFITDAFYAQGVEKLSYIGNKRLPNFLTCRFKENVFDDYMKCTGYRTWDYTEYINRFIESTSGKWFVKIFDDKDRKHQLKFLN